jgi:hypothetical protein
VRLTDVNAVKRRVRRYGDWARVAWSKRSSPAPCEPFDGQPRVTLLSVSFNTRELTKLMLLSLADQPWASRLGRIVIVDNRSSDGSPTLLEQLSRTTRIESVLNDGPTSHGFGLRHGVSWVEQSEQGLPAKQRTNLYLIVDTDIIFLRPDTLDACGHDLASPDVGALGELQFDLGEPYAHPCCLFVRRDALADGRVWPFVDHGAPALWLEQSLRCAGRKVLDFPLRTENHIVHRGRASIAAVNRLGLRDAYASVRDQAHFHGNPQGAQLWAEVEARHAAHLGELNDAACGEYLAAKLGSRPF